jgi:hypothetical protein
MLSGAMGVERELGAKAYKHVRGRPPCHGRTSALRSIDYYGTGDRARD